MLSKKNRLPLSFGFSEFKKKALLCQFLDFGILYFENKKEESRFAFIVSKKVDKRAVIRNKYKRILSEIIFKELKKIKPGFDIVFLVKSSIVGKSFLEIEKEIKSALKKENLYEKDNSLLN
jgi:ribonuclease P protein component